MYGLVMLTALSSGADVTPAPQPAPVVMGYGCGGSCVGIGGGCYGMGGGCYGSRHGFRHGHGNGLFGHHRAACHGCNGGGCSGWSCFGSCNGCFGGGCFGGGCLGGGCWGPSPAQFPMGAAMSVGGPMMSYSDPWAVYGRVNRPPVVIVPIDAVKPMDIPIAPRPKEGMGAVLKFKLPADAKLYVDGRLTMIGGAERAFSTPMLAEGQQYYYDVKAEIVVDGKPVIEEKRVLVEAGAKVTETFSKLIAAIEGKTITVEEQ
jgi:uncharacterized protein (TIGR03000 family)